MALLQGIEADILTVNKISIVPALLDVVCRTTGMGFAAIARVTDKQWVACSVKDDISFGLKPGGELKLETTICNEIRQHHQPVVIDHVSQDEKFATHHTPLMYGFQSYISMPITRKDGTFFGTLCAIDPNPHKVSTPEIVGMFRLFADLISFHIDSVEKMNVSEKNLLEERAASVLREQFIAVLGHDLRTPLSAVATSSQLLLRSPLTAEATKLANIIKNSSARMKVLIENMLDFTRARLGAGMKLNSKKEDHIEEVLSHVINELLVATPDRQVETTFEIDQPIYCDEKRIAQLFSNLLSNALSYGQPDQPVKINASTNNGNFTLSVSNASPKISKEIMARLFKPFSRGEVEANQEGLGLGLYIASEIADAHKGTITVNSLATETTFIFEMPIGG